MADETESSRGTNGGQAVRAKYGSEFFREIGRKGGKSLKDKGTDYAVFFGAQTTQKPKKYDRPDATANAAISARLPYMMASSRIAHYLKVIARDKIGSFMEASECEDWLNRWVSNYINLNDGGQETKAK